jgi:hypothetical protein
MSFWKPKSGKNKNKIPRHVKNLVKMQEKNVRKNEDPEKDSLVRYNEIGNRARRGFHHDGPGGNYEGF